MIKPLDNSESGGRENNVVEKTFEEERVAGDLEVVTFRESLAKDFADLNYEWIAKDYLIEEHDREILDNPLEKIIAPGGQIFFAIVQGKTAGTAALENLNPDGFELVKMAVAPEFRGLGIGGRLIEACIDYTLAHDRSRITLDSNTKQAAAISLYRKYGFGEVPLDPDSPYSRVNIRMELALPPPRM